jgi:hypothetical protein
MEQVHVANPDKATSGLKLHMNYQYLRKPAHIKYCFQSDTYVCSIDQIWGYKFYVMIY